MIFFLSFLFTKYNIKNEIVSIGKKNKKFKNTLLVLFNKWLANTVNAVIPTLAKQRVIIIDFFIQNTSVQ